MALAHASSQRFRRLEGLRRIASYVAPLQVVSGALAGMVGAYFAYFGRGPEQIFGLVALALAALIVVWLVMRDTDVPMPVPDAPAIRGLATFNEYDKDRFFGRESETGILVQRVEDDTHLLTLVEGPPSSGRTSLLRAGLIPKLDSHLWKPFYLRVDDEVEPLEAIRQHLAEDGNPPPTATLDELLVEYSRRIQRTPVIILDDFERLFVTRDGAARLERLTSALGKALDERSGQVRVIICFSAGFDEHIRQTERLLGQVVPSSARLSVERFAPSSAAALLKAMADNDRALFSPGLRAAIVHDLVRGGTVCPAELQATSKLTRDAHIRSLPGYERVGRAQGIFCAHVNRIVAAIDSATSVGPARHILSVLSDAAIRSAEAGVSIEDVVNSYGDPERETGKLEAEVLTQTLTRLVDDHLVRQVDVDKYALVHSYFGKDIKAALSDRPSSARKAWWLSRSIAAAYVVPFAVALAAVAVIGNAALSMLGTPAAQPRWSLTGPGAVPGNALWAFGPNSGHLATDDNSQMFIWDISPARLVAVGTPIQAPMRTLADPPRRTDGDSFVPYGVGFLADESEAYRISLNSFENLWMLERVPLTDTRSPAAQTGPLASPGGGACTPDDAAWSRNLDTMAVAYDCGPIVLVPTGPNFVPLTTGANSIAAEGVGRAPGDACEPRKIALHGGVRRVAVAYKCTSSTDPTDPSYAEVVTWEIEADGTLYRIGPVTLAGVHPDDIMGITFRWDYHVTIAAKTPGELDLLDASTDPATPLMRNQTANLLSPAYLWPAPDGRLLAVEKDAPELRLEDLDLWLGPVRVPSNLPFRPPVPEISVSF